MTLIIGYGNTLMGDDGFGIHIVEKLQTKVNNPNINFILTYQLTPELSFEIKDFKKVIFIDASYGTPNFSIACPIMSDVNSTLISHHLNPKLLIDTTNELFNIDIEFEIYSVLVEKFKMQEQLSIEMNNPLNQILEYLKKDLTNF